MEKHFLFRFTFSIGVNSTQNNTNHSNIGNKNEDSKMAIIPNGNEMPMNYDGQKQQSDNNNKRQCQLETLFALAKNEEFDDSTAMIGMGSDEEEEEDEGDQQL